MVTAMLLAAFLLTPFGAFFLLLMIYKKPSLRHKYASFVGLLFGMMGYCTRPVRTIDISRYFEQIDGIRELPFSQAAGWMDDGLIVKNVFFWLIAKIGDNQLLPFFSLLIIYGITTYVLADALEDDDKKLFGNILLLQILQIPFYTVFSNVRNVVAFAFLLLAVYRDLYRQKRDIITLVLYIVPCYIHLTGFVIVIVRFSVPIIKRMSYLGTAMTFAVPTSVVALYPRLRSISLPGNIGKVISRAIWKAYASVIRTSDYAQEVQTHGSFVANRALAAVFCVLLMYLIIQYQDIYRSTKRTKYEYSIYVEIMTIISFMLTAIGVVKYWVFMYMVYISCSPILIEFAHKQEGKKKKAYYCYIFIWIVMGLRFVLQLRSMYKNLDIAWFMERILFTNYPMVVFQIIKGIATMH